MHCPPRWISSFCVKKSCSCSVVIDLICFSICDLFSSGKLSNCPKRCFLIFFASSGVKFSMDNCREKWL